MREAGGVMTEEPSRPDKADVERAYQFALRLLAYRARSRRELAQRLSARFPQEAIASALSLLEEHGYLNDAAFAQEWRRSREAHRPRSASLVRRELAQHGVPSEVAQAAVEGMDDIENAYRAAQHHAKALAKLDYVTFARRLTAYLLRRGFPSDVVRRTVLRVWEGRGNVGT